MNDSLKLIQKRGIVTRVEVCRMRFTALICIDSTLNSLHVNQASIYNGQQPLLFTIESSVHWKNNSSRRFPIGTSYGGRNDLNGTLLFVRQHHKINMDGKYRKADTGGRGKSLLNSSHEKRLDSISSGRQTSPKELLPIAAYHGV